MFVYLLSQTRECSMYINNMDEVVTYSNEFMCGARKRTSLCWALSDSQSVYALNGDHFRQIYRNNFIGLWFRSRETGKNSNKMEGTHNICNVYASHKNPPRTEYTDSQFTEYLYAHLLSWKKWEALSEGGGELQVLLKPIKNSYIYICLSVSLWIGCGWKCVQKDIRYFEIGIRVKKSLQHVSRFYCITKQI